ncbi:MAG: dihydrofolate reductase family protein [Cytophagales bacterium]|jgi:dihydrofolate reductase|nr:dihydrofolate reductase family protein [Cytophagales bacterium]
MKRIVYYVAVSLDGYIAGLNGDVSGFVTDGAGVQQYLDDLQSFGTVIMGRKTYEFGYQFGFKAGQAVYPHMNHYILSRSLVFDNSDPKVKVVAPDVAFVNQLKKESETDIYLCGGGELAGWLLDNEQIDVLKIKLNPLIVGSGIRLFGNATKKFKTELISSQVYDQGLQIMEYRMRY